MTYILTHAGCPFSEVFPGNLIWNSQLFHSTHLTQLYLSFAIYACLCMCVCVREREFYVCRQQKTEQSHGDEKLQGTHSPLNYWFILTCIINWKHTILPGKCMNKNYISISKLTYNQINIKSKIYLPFRVRSLIGKFM